MLILISTLLFLAWLFIFILTWVSGFVYLSRPNRETGPSPLILPFVAPSLVALLVVLNELPMWLIVAAFFSDFSSLLILAFIPRLLRDLWETSRFTCLLGLFGTHGNAKVKLTLHRSGKYLLKKKWPREFWEVEMIELGEVGTFTVCEDGFELHDAVSPIRRKLREKNGGYRVEDEQGLNYSEKGGHRLLNCHLNVSGEISE